MSQPQSKFEKEGNDNVSGKGGEVLEEDWNNMNNNNNTSSSDFAEMRMTGIEKFDEVRQQMYSVIVNDKFQTAVIGMIVINSILMGVNTYLPESGTEEYDNASDAEQRAVNAIALIDFIFLILFTIELTFNLSVFLHMSFTDKWLLFDATTIISSWALSEFTIMRSFRIFRVFRLFGRIESLKIIIEAIMSTSAGLASIVLVLLILFYVFAVMFTQLFKDCWEDCCYAPDVELCEKANLISMAATPEIHGIDYFGRLDYSFFTLFLVSFLFFITVVVFTSYQYVRLLTLILF